MADRVEGLFDLAARRTFGVAFDPKVLKPIARFFRGTLIEHVRSLNLTKGERDDEKTT
jgi:hypothetical protein